jgi:hypothetical protein
MKTKTYLRLSLWTPFLVWVICTVIFAIWSRVAPDGPGSDGSEGPVMIILLPLLFYVFGIIGWLIPYLLLSMILLIWSFRSQAQTLMKVFALSPLVMAMFVLILVNVLSIGSTDMSQFLTDPTSNAADFLGSNALFTILTLVWGYVCVGIGYAIYKILQKRGVIKDEEMVASTPLNEPS